jgi:hypothetical protein
VGRHAQPAVRHEAFRLVCAASGARPSLVDESLVWQALAAGPATTSMRAALSNPVRVEESCSVTFCMWTNMSVKHKVQAFCTEVLRMSLFGGNARHLTCR